MPQPVGVSGKWRKKRTTTVKYWAGGEERRGEERSASSKVPCPLIAINHN